MKNETWEKIERVAPFIGVKNGAFRVWKIRGHVPAKHHYDLIQKAPEANVDLSLEELHDLQKSPPAHRQEGNA